MNETKPVKTNKDENARIKLLLLVAFSPSITSTNDFRYVLGTYAVKWTSEVRLTTLTMLFSWIVCRIDWNSNSRPRMSGSSFPKAS